MMLLDSSALLAIQFDVHPHHHKVDELVVAQLNRRVEAVVAPQCLYEFYVVATRPKAVNGYGRTSSEVGDRLQHILSSYRFIPDPANLLHVWRQLVLDFDVSGKPAHDARLVAWMRSVGVRQLLTLNPKDFARYGSSLDVLTV